MKNIELLAPAGDLEKLRIAIDYGADAVYCGGEQFSLRTASRNFTIEELAEGLDYAHNKGKKVYLTLNIFAHNEDLPDFYAYMDEIKDLPIDAFLISDPGILQWMRENRPDAELHLSTQTNTTNKLSALYWHKQGAKRIVLARELSLKEIAEIKRETPDTLELEAFVHGAMCISYSGRCLLSNYLAGRDANRGACAHPCRWSYNLVEEKRPGEYYPVVEDYRGTYILNSKDLCMIQHLPALINAGVNSLKIEGRVKSVFYVATVTDAYRKAIDAYLEEGEDWFCRESWLEEVGKASHRHFTTGFYFGKPGEEDQNYKSSQYISEYEFTGIVKDYDERTRLATVEQRNKMSLGDKIEFFGPGIEPFVQTLEYMTDEDGMLLESAPHAQQILKIRTIRPVKENYMVCKPK
ncbi:MAG: U32 family peptidase [Clostridiales Family XIII bacterium]|jgi:putative protease|nr:U32 family peptidase [Clostridiales Family XIII bacterium]